MDHTGSFVRLTDVGDLMTARLTAALLADAGIESRLRGEALGPYPVTVGRMATIEIWVAVEDLEDARLIMLEIEIDHTMEPAMRRGAVADPGSLPMRLLALLIAAGVAYAVVRELMRVF